MGTENGSSSSKSDKFNKAVDRARGVEGEHMGDAPSIPMSGALVVKASEAEIRAIMSDPDLEFAPQVKSLEEGEMVVGFLEGNGPDAEFTDTDKATGEVKHKIVKTWIIAAPDGGQRISILSSAQLDRKLPPFVGGVVKIVRGKDVKTGGGFRVTDYLVAGPKKSDGSRRNFARPAVIEAAASESHRQLATASEAVNAEDLT